MSESSSASPTTALFWFFIITTIYFFIKYYITDPSQTKIYLGIYLTLVIIGEYIINLSLTDTMCGSRQWNTALLVTLIPWVFIFGILNVVLMLFPGWLAPFSNTFGYGIAKLMGVSSVLTSIFKDKIEPSATDNKIMVEALAHIYNDQSLLVNEITESNFPNFWKNMEQLMKPGVFTNEELKQKLLGFVRMKDIIAEYIWYMLTGGLVTSVGYNYVVNAGCIQNLKDMKRRDNEYTENAQQKLETQRDNKPRVYTSSE
jgi:hypothetical protein